MPEQTAVHAASQSRSRHAEVTWRLHWRTCPSLEMVSTSAVAAWADTVREAPGMPRPYHKRASRWALVWLTFMLDRLSLV